MTLLFYYLFGNIHLGSYGIDGYNRIGYIQTLQDNRNRCYLVTFIFYFLLSNT